MCNVGLQSAESHLKFIQFLVLSARVLPEAVEDCDEYQHDHNKHASTNNDCYDNHNNAFLLFFKPYSPQGGHLVTQPNLKIKSHVTYATSYKQ